ncbi:MAG: chromosomal replication initiator protein DnaA [Candidatus Pacebacteria bacterium]|nr:chromosomal replication initiator protein DnaA [Candidatus Paceibacterota bacterium]MCD8563895.1 chromosomal replication initiator protein DnaA [Candidatus Paceibacterota bacterium]
MTIIQPEKIWEQVLNEIELSVSKANFATWFKNTFIYKEKDGVIYIGIPNQFTKEWLHPKYTKEFIRLLRKHSGEHIRSVEYVTGKKQPEPVVVKEKPKTEESTQQTSALPLDNLYVNRKDNLNPRYTFETFIIGSFNELAYSAAQGILQKPGVYNPLFIYGSTGVGKTHLIQATGNDFKKRYPRAKIFYTSAEKFSNDYVHSVQNNTVTAFKNKYREYDVLIMDDVQFLSGKQKTQDELFHLFNILYDENKQIMFSSDKHPNYIPGLEDRLKSRFSAGMIVDVTRPEYESRVALLRSKALEQNVFIRDEIIQYLAENIEGNIRELEGLLNSLMVNIQIKNTDLSLEDVKKLIKNNVSSKKNISVEHIVKVVTDFYNIEAQSIYDKTRRKEIVHSRQVIMYLMREDFNISFPAIGRKLGGRDHTTVIHSHARIRDDIAKEPHIAQEIEQIRSILSM